MALTDSNDPDPRPAETIPRAAAAILPRAALDRLPQLHAESSETSRLAAFLQGAVNAAGSLTLLAVILLSFAADTSLRACFSWALLVLVGVGALLRSYIRSTAAAFDRAPLGESAKDLRAILLYTGFAWGAGAFLLLAPAPSPLRVLLFAVLPSAGAALLLKDRDGALAFLLPVTVMTLAATVLRPWPDAGLITALLLMLQSGIAAHIILQSRRLRSGIPAGLLLR